MSRTDRVWFPLIAVGLLSLLLAGCGGGGGGSDDGDDNGTTVTFTHSPMDLDDVLYIQPLGNLNPPGHTYPSDHIGFYFADPNQTYPIYAHATSTIIRIYKRTASNASGYDYKLTFRHTSKISSYLDHVVLSEAMLAAAGNLHEGSNEVSIAVTAGQTLGTAGGPPGDLKGMDLGVMDTSSSLPGFIHPERYYDGTRYCRAPLSYYPEPLRSSLYALVRCDGENKDGKIDYDVLGRLVGTWFSEGAGMDEWERQLSFVYEPQHPAQVRVSMGGELGLCEVFSIPDSAPRPAEVSEATGKVAYQLRYPYFNSNQPAAGLLIVQVTGPETIKVELFVGSQATDAEFTAAARTYIR